MAEEKDVWCDECRYFNNDGLLKSCDLPGGEKLLTVHDNAVNDCFYYDEYESKKEGD